MAKRPEMGRVKTRLARGLGAVEATRFYRQTTYDVFRRLGSDSRWQTVLALSPDSTVHEASLWPVRLPRIAQGVGDLGHRMGRLMRDLPLGPVVIVGSDIPDISVRHIAAAFRRLGQHDAVFGPSDDGGYWLVGLRRRPRIVSIFQNVRWSSDHALADTLDNVRHAGLSWKCLDTLIDVDTIDDFKRRKISIK